MERPLTTDNPEDLLVRLVELLEVRHLVALTTCTAYLITVRYYAIDVLFYQAISYSLRS